MLPPAQNGSGAGVGAGGMGHVLPWGIARAGEATGAGALPSAAAGGGRVWEAAPAPLGAGRDPPGRAGPCCAGRAGAV